MMKKYLFVIMYLNMGVHILCSDTVGSFPAQELQAELNKELEEEFGPERAVMVKKQIDKDSDGKIDADSEEVFAHDIASGVQQIEQEEDQNLEHMLE